MLTPLSLKVTLFINRILADATKLQIFRGNHPGLLVDPTFRSQEKQEDFERHTHTVCQVEDRSRETGTGLPQAKECQKLKEAKIAPLPSHLGRSSTLLKALVSSFWPPELWKKKCVVLSHQMNGPGKLTPSPHLTCCLGLWNHSTKHYVELKRKMKTGAKDDKACELQGRNLGQGHSPRIHHGNLGKPLNHNNLLIYSLVK